MNTNFVLSLLKINKPFIWIFVGIAFRFFIFTLQPEPQSYFSTRLWGHFTGDTQSYIKPVEHLLKFGAYDSDFRMPGYGWVYYCLRLMFSTLNASNVLVLLQVILSGAAVYFLAMTAFLLSNSKKVFISVYILSLLTTYSAVYDSYFLTESFCTSSGIFAIYFLVIALKRNKFFPFLWSGLFFTWMIFLKPVYLGLFLIFLILLIFISFSKKWSIQIPISQKNILFLILPFILFDSIWTIRNYTVNHKINLLTNPFFSPKEDKDYPKALTVFLQSWGGVHSVWMPLGHNLWFEGDTSEQKTIVFPSYLTRGKVKMDSLSMLRNFIQNTRNISLPEYDRIKNDILATSMLMRLTQYVKDELPVNYYIYTPLRYAKMFYADSGTYLLFYKPFSELSFFQKKIVIFLSAMQYIIFIFGSMASIYFILRIKKIPFSYVFPGIIVLYTFIIFPFVLRMPETRFMVPAFPFQIICLVLLISNAFISLKKKNQPSGLKYL